MKLKFKIICFVFFLAGTCNLFAQEFLTPLKGRINYYNYPEQKINSLNNKLKSLDESDTLPFFEDFYYAPLSPYATIDHWTDSSVYVNTGMAIAPPSIGVATFDGLNKNGYPYNLSAGPIVSAFADYLTSKRINLFSKGTHTYTPGDSIGFSFLYQTAGFGDNPEVSDSLVLEFSKPLVAVAVGTTTIKGKWEMVWSSRGKNNPTINDSTFKRAFLYVTDTAYFHDGFRFRFRNKATTSGNLDIWNVDYIKMAINNLKNDTLIEDVSFAYVPRPFLKNYSAMPFKQFIPGEMGTKTSNFIRNNYEAVATSTKNVVYEYSIYDSNNNNLNTYLGGACNVADFKKWGYDPCPAHSNPSISYTFIPTDTTFFKIVHSLSTNPDSWKNNDTVVQIQPLYNYYAYDDGSAEAGYYLNVNGAKTALRFTLNVTDTLQAMDIFFDPIIQGNLIQNSSFRMMVWGDAVGQPGTVLLRDSSMLPKYLQYGYNKIPRYAFTSPLVLGPGTYYFGVQQLLAQQLNIGFDRNINHNNALFYDISGIWNQSAIVGSLMIHPIFGRPAYAVGINENKPMVSESVIKIYPNPAGDLLNISVEKQNSDENFSIDIYSSLGEKIMESNLSEPITQINTANFSVGIYFIALRQKNVIVSNQKLIISR